MRASLDIVARKTSLSLEVQLPVLSGSVLPTQMVMEYIRRVIEKDCVGPHKHRTEGEAEF